jgi:hypothetical protein
MINNLLMQFKQQIINNLQVSPSNQTKKGEPIGSPFQKKIIH